MKQPPTLELLESRTLLAAALELFDDDVAYANLGELYEDGGIASYASQKFSATKALSFSWPSVSLEDAKGPMSATATVEASATPCAQPTPTSGIDIESEREQRIFLGKLQDYLEEQEVRDPKFDILMKRWSLMEDPTTLLQEKIEIAKRMGHSLLTHGYAINTGYVISLATPLVVTCQHSEFLFLQVNAGSTLIAIFCAGLEILDHNFNEALGEAKIDAYEDAMESYDHTLTILDQMGNDTLLDENTSGDGILGQKLKEYNSYKSSYILGQELDADAETGGLISKTWGYVALSSLGALLVEQSSAKVLLAKSNPEGIRYNDLHWLTRLTALPQLANVINFSNNAIATGLFSNDVWSQYEGWSEHSDTGHRALTLSQQCQENPCSQIEWELTLVANLIYEAQRPTSQLIGMGWSSLKLTAAVSSFIPTLASFGLAQQGQVPLAQKLTTWGYLLGSAGFVAQGAIEAGLSRLYSFLWPAHSTSDTALVEYALKAELFKAVDSGAQNDVAIQQKMDYLLSHDKAFSISFLLHHLAQERNTAIEKKLRDNPQFKSWELTLKDITGPVTRFLQAFDNTISEADLLALSHYSGEPDSEALLRRRLHV